MTVCIAALCDGGKACVVAADKMLVSGGGNFEFKIDGRLEKIRKLSSDSVLMHSGNDADAAEIVELAAPLIAERPSNVRSIVTDAVDRLLNARRDQKVSQLLGKKFDFDSLVAAMSDLTTGPLYDLWKEVRQPDFGVTLLVCRDKERFEIYFLSPGSAPSRCSTPYSSIGSGGDYSIVALTVQRYEISLPVAEALFQVYLAKRAAEVRAYGVGESVDMKILTCDHITDIGAPTRDLLKRYYSERLRLTDEQRDSVQQSI
jgi:ATP-dependent protease HslVU (ClpYQ) peptidase subunit